MTSWDGRTLLTTARLTLRTFRRDDLPLYAALNRDPAVYRWLGGEPISREWSDEIAAWANDCVDADGFGLVAVERTADSVFLGMCGLHHQESFPDDVEAAWRLGSAHWGRGYATEAARAWVAHGFDVVGLERIISTTDRDNVRSQAVMARLGMTYERDVRMVDDGQEFDAVLWSVSADAWDRSHR
jgi:RimJ/RimL family protein N-acetyltransferase